MMNRLMPIIEQKRREVARLETFLQAHSEHPIAQILQGNRIRDGHRNFQQALRGSGLSVIAEIKRQSPSKGELAAIVDPVILAESYVAGGADALSILTDDLFFKGTLADLQSVSQAQAIQTTPILRKDFIVDVRQIAESVFAGADAILAIVAVLGKNTAVLLNAAKNMHIDVVVEVHTRSELELALDCGAEIIGVNNRDLTTFQIDTRRAFNLVEYIPETVVRIAESGIKDPVLARDYHQAGFDAVLIGESLVTTDLPGQFIEACHAH